MPRIGEWQDLFQRQEFRFHRGPTRNPPNPPFKKGGEGGISGRSVPLGLVTASPRFDLKDRFR
jgi:hypothetical protein